MQLLRVTTSPGSTWLWAEDDLFAAWVRDVLNAAGVPWVPATTLGAEVVEATDVGTDPEAVSACATLRAAGFTLEWHPLQHPSERGNGLVGGPLCADGDASP